MAESMQKKPERAVTKQLHSLDEAMTLTGFGIHNIATMLLSGLILMGMIMLTLNMSYVIPAAQCDLNLTTTKKGWLAAIPFVAIILTSHMWGWIADTRGRRPTMLVSMSISVVLVFISSFMPGLASFAAVQFLACIFISGPSGVVYAYLGEMNSLRHRDKMVAFGAAFVGVGTCALPAVSWLILPQTWRIPIGFLGIEYRPWRLLVVASSVPYALASFCMMVAPESPKYLNTTGQQERCLEILRQMFSVNRWGADVKFPVRALKQDQSSTARSSLKGAAGVLRSMADQTLPLFRAPLLVWTCLSCFVQFGIFATANGFYLWFPTILNSLSSHEGAETRICDVLLAQHESYENGTMICDDTVNTATFERAIFVGLVFCTMYIVVGSIVDFAGKRPILVVLLSVAGVSGMAAPLVYSQQLAVALFGVFQMSGACIGLMTAVVVELYPTKLRAMAVCLSLMMGRVGSVLGSNVIGRLLTTYCSASFYIFGGLLVLCAVLCLALPGSQKTEKSTHQPPAVAAQNETHEPV